MKRTALSLVSLALAGGLVFPALFSGFSLTLAAQTPKKLAVQAPVAGGDSAVAAPSSGSRIPVPLGALRLENDSANLVYYTVLPFKPADLNSLLSQPKLVLEKLKAAGTSLSYLPPRTVAPAIKVNELEQLVLGFAVESGASAWKVWYLRVPTKGLRPVPPVFVVSQSRTLADATGQPLDLKTVDFELPASPVRIDGRFVDWLKYEDLLSWSERNPPAGAVRQADGKSANINLANAQFWAKAGTDLEHFRMIRSKTELLVMVSSRSLMSRGLSGLLRLYESPTAKNPSAVLEIPLDAATGLTLAWETGKADPRVVGDFATADYYLEARFRLEDLPANLSALQGKDWQVELSTSFSQPGQSEEFFLGRFPAGSIRLVE